MRFEARGRKLILGARQTSSLRWGVAHGGVRWKSQQRKKLCLSLLMSKNLKLKKVIKSFIPKPKESRQVFRVFSDSYMFMNICERFPYPYEYVYFLCSYLGHIYLDVNILHVFFYVSDLEIVYYNNYKSSIAMPWRREEKYFTLLLVWRQNYSKLCKQHFSGNWNYPQKSEIYH